MHWQVNAQASCLTLAAPPEPLGYCWLWSCASSDDGALDPIAAGLAYDNVGAAKAHCPPSARSRDCLPLRAVILRQGRATAATCAPFLSNVECDVLSEEESGGVMTREGFRDFLARFATTQRAHAALCTFFNLVDTAAVGTYLVQANAG